MSHIPLLLGSGHSTTNSHDGRCLQYFEPPRFPGENIFQEVIRMPYSNSCKSKPLSYILHQRQWERELQSLHQQN